MSEVIGGNSRNQAAMASGLQRFGIPTEAIIGDVHIDYLHPLGGGSDATVYPGTWNAPVAVKSLHPVLIQPGNEGREQFMARFGEECVRLRDLRHENIVQFMGVCTTRDDGPGLVTEKMAETLEERYTSSELSVREQMDIFWEVTSALVYLHIQGVVHRDLTTRNVLLTERSRGGIAKVADVGLSRSLGMSLAGSSPHLTLCPGSQLYMPPEAFDNPPRYDEKLDCFALGVLMMSTIIRREPSREVWFSARSQRQADGTERPIPESERRAVDFNAIPDGHPAKRLIARCLRNDTSARPSAKEILEELRGLRMRRRPEQEERLRREIGGCFDCRRKDEEIRSHLAGVDRVRQQLADSCARADLLEERLFIQNVCSYNREQASFSSYFMTGHVTAEFPQWERMSSPLPAAVNKRCHTAVHREHLYISSGSKYEGCVICCTVDAREWHRLMPPPHVIGCNGMISDGDHLYFLFLDHDSYSVLFELGEIDMLDSDVDYGRKQVTWQLLPNSRSPVRQISPALFIDKQRSRLIIIGGKADGTESSNNLSSVSEYCLDAKNWINPGAWPQLPRPRQIMVPVLLQHSLYLLGDQPLIKINISDLGEWANDQDMPAPSCCGSGACGIFNTIVVAGGYTRQAQAAVHTFNRKNREWLQLPSLKERRHHPSLIRFRNHLLAVGGWNGKWLHSVEQLSLSYFSTS